MEGARVVKGWANPYDTSMYTQDYDSSRPDGVSISEEQIIDRVPDGPMKNGKCGGGHPVGGIEYLAAGNVEASHGSWGNYFGTDTMTNKLGGACSLQDYPYVSGNGDGSDSFENGSCEKPLAPSSEFVGADDQAVIHLKCKEQQSSTECLKLGLMRHGPAAIGGPVNVANWRALMP